MPKCRLTRTPDRTPWVPAVCAVCGVASGGIMMDLKTNTTKGITFRKDDEGHYRCQVCWIKTT